MSAVVKPPTREQQTQQIAWLEAEIERLTAALREIADYVPGNVYGAEGTIARAALEGDEALFPTKKICPECGQRMREGDYCDHIPF